MERWAPVQARERPRRRPGQPSFSSTLLDAICDAMDDQPGGATTTADTAAAMRKQRSEAAALHCYYYYKPSLAASHRVAAPEAGAADDCHGGRGYFSSSEIEHSFRRLRPIRTSAAAPQPEKQQAQQQPTTTTTEKARRARKPANGPARRPASPGARLAGLLNAIFTGKRHSARQHPAPPEDEPSTARPSKTTPPPSHSARPSRSRRGRTVRFLDIDGEVAVAAAVSGRRQVPVVEVEEVLFRPADTDVGEESSDGSSDLFELDNLAAAAPAGGGGGRNRRACGDELPVYGTTGVGLRRGDIGRRRPFGYGSLARSYSRVV
ncbi:hypothetical protein PR202_ga00140 [Eleusine coracana subsp. coracana]|uniref:Uncharacterized protein n=1 Tax=Eleusine coracana subsp. coracana TaxID=191504 RepID=A0AAV5BFR2_ELECO|nr:hypothetical protein QOZ80_2AG0123300 [Eleusine coracana subsp. coracana]GJM84470.1 hypothetical protein PR202_ga00140 [Eleusine coracana subsp. coracana]